MEVGRGGACVPARVAPTRAHPSLNSPRTMRMFLVWKRRCPPASPHKGAFIVEYPMHNACIGWYGYAAVRTFGRAHRHRPYGFVWADCAWTVDAV